MNNYTDRLQRDGDAQNGLTGGDTISPATQEGEGYGSFNYLPILEKHNPKPGRGLPGWVLNAFLEYSQKITTSFQPKKQEGEDIRKEAIAFGTWYSGMEQSKVERAYNRYLNEQLTKKDFRTDFAGNMCACHYSHPNHVPGKKCITHHLILEEKDNTVTEEKGLRQQAIEWWYPLDDDTKRKYFNGYKKWTPAGNHHALTGGEIQNIWAAQLTPSEPSSIPVVDVDYTAILEKYHSQDEKQVVDYEKEAEDIYPNPIKDSDDEYVDYEEYHQLLRGVKLSRIAHIRARQMSSPSGQKPKEVVLLTGEQVEEFEAYGQLIEEMTDAVGNDPQYCYPALKVAKKYMVAPSDTNRKEKRQIAELAWNACKRRIEWKKEMGGNSLTEDLTEYLNKNYPV